MKAEDRSGRDTGVSTTSRILTAARAMFYQKGFFTTSVEEIAAAGGVSRATVYLHFKSKDEMLTALLQEDLEHQLGVYKKLAQTQRISVASMKKWLLLFRQEIENSRSSLDLFSAAGASASQPHAIVGSHRDNVISVLGRRFPGFDIDALDRERREVQRARCYMMLFLIEGVSIGFSSRPGMPSLKIGVDILAATLAHFMRFGEIETSPPAPA